MKKILQYIIIFFTLIVGFLLIRDIAFYDYEKFFIHTIHAQVDQKNHTLPIINTTNFVWDRICIKFSYQAPPIYDGNFDIKGDYYHSLHAGSKDEVNYIDFIHTKKRAIYRIYEKGNFYLQTITSNNGINKTHCFNKADEFTLSVLVPTPTSKRTITLLNTGE